MSKSSKFKCPKCLSDVVVSPELAGTKTQCPVCDATLTVPLSLGHDSLFDDLFDEDQGPADDVNGESLSNDDPNGHAATSGSGDATVDESRSETKSPNPLELARNPTLSESKAEVPISELVAPDAVSIADVADGDESPDALDPFSYDENKAIHIDGVSDGLLAPGSFYFKCPVCDSHMKGNENQLGEKVRCTDCYSDIPVVKPKKSDKEDAWRRPATLKTSDDDQELKLADPIERAPIDYTISPEHGLEEIKNDLLSPIVEPELASEPAPTIAKPRDRKSGGRSGKKHTTLKTGAKQRSNATVNSRESEETRKPIQFKDAARFEFFGDLDLVLRTSVSVIFLTLFYAMEESVFRTLQMEDLDWGEKFMRYFPALIGSFVCFLLFGWFMAVTFSVLMQNAANGMKRVEQWVGFAPSEWMGSFLIFAISAWAAFLPGALLGYLMMKVSGMFFFMPVLACMSFCVMLPVFLISAFVNQSVYKVWSPEIVGSIGNDFESWFEAYKSFLVPAGLFFLGILIVFLPGLIFSFIGAVLQVVGITIYGLLIGMQARSVTAGKIIAT